MALSDAKNGKPDIRLLTGVIGAVETRVQWAMTGLGALPNACTWQPSLEWLGERGFQVKLGPFHAAKLLALINFSVLSCFFFLTLDISMSIQSAGLMNRE